MWASKTAWTPDQTNNHILQKRRCLKIKNAQALLQKAFYPIILKKSELASWLWFCMCRNIDFGFLGFQEFPSFKSKQSQQLQTSHPMSYSLHNGYLSLSFEKENPCKILDTMIINTFAAISFRERQHTTHFFVATHNTLLQHIENWKKGKNSK